MKLTLIQRGLAATALTVAALGAFAQSPAGSPPGPQTTPPGPARMHGMGPGMMAEHHNPAGMQQHRAERHIARMAVLKSRLKLSPEQEAAWKSFEDGMKPAPRMPLRPGDMATLSTPERMDRMQAQLADRQAELKKRTEVVKSFYATLSADQKKTFDESARHAMQGHARPHGGGHHGNHHGPRG